MEAKGRIAELEAKLDEVEARLVELTQALAARDARIAELEGLLEESRRSGKRQAAPFRKGGPKEAPARPGRKKGDAHGRHGRHGRRAAPADPDRTLEAPLPERRPRCGDGVDFERWADQRQTELPEARPVLTRFRVGVGRCRGCRRRVQGRRPEQTSDALGAAAAQLGPRAMAWGTWLRYGLGLSFAKRSQLLGRLGIDVTAGALCAGSASTSADLVPTQRAIEAHVSSSPAVTMDETGWRIGGEGAWLWTAATADATLYDVARGRGFAEAAGLVPQDYAGVVVRDGWAAYGGYEKAAHQSCLSHYAEPAIMRKRHATALSVAGFGLMLSA